MNLMLFNYCILQITNTNINYIDKLYLFFKKNSQCFYFCRFWVDIVGCL